GGQIHRSDVYREDYQGHAQRYDADTVANQYPVGAVIDCRYNPADPAESFLESETPWFLAPFLLIPVMFLVVPLTIILTTWRDYLRSRPGISGKTTISTEPISGSTRGRLFGRLGAAGFF